MRARGGKILGLKGCHDQRWEQRFEQEKKTRNPGAATRHGIAGCPGGCCKPKLDLVVCEICGGHKERGVKGKPCAVCGNGHVHGGNEEKWITVVGKYHKRHSRRKHPGDQVTIRTTTERIIRQKGGIKEADKRASSGDKSEQLATMRHIYGMECEGGVIQEKAREIGSIIRSLIMLIHEYEGAGTLLAEQLETAEEYISGSAAERKARPHYVWEAYRRTIGSDLESVIQWLEDTSLGDLPEKAQKEAKRKLAETIACATGNIAKIVQTEHTSWKERSDKLTTFRESRENQRERMRMILRAWRQDTDGINAGAATFDTKWNSGKGLKLARRLTFGSNAAAQFDSDEGVRWVTTLLRYMKLTRNARREIEVQTGGDIQTDWRGDVSEGRVSEKDIMSTCATRDNHKIKDTPLFAMYEAGLNLTQAERRKRGREDKETEEKKEDEKQAKKQMRGTEGTNQTKQPKCCRDKRKRGMENEEEGKGDCDRRVEGEGEGEEKEDAKKEAGCIDKNKRRKVGKDRELNWSEEALGRFIAWAEGIPSGTVTMVGGVQTVIETGGKEEPTVRPPEEKSRKRTRSEYKIP